MEHGKGLFYFCIERTQRDRIDTNLGGQALLGHTNSPIEKCRSRTTLADRLPRHDFARARMHAYVSATPRVWNTVYPHYETISVLCIRWIREVDNFAILKRSRSLGHVQSNGKATGGRERKVSGSFFGRTRRENVER